MIKEFQCTDAEHAPITFEKRFTNYEHYEYCLAHDGIYCPTCGDTANVKPTFSLTAPPQFKGSGFHTTDYPKTR